MEVRDNQGPPVMPRRYGEAPPPRPICSLLRPRPHPCPGFPPFPSQERSILLSIESLGQTLLGSMAGVPHNALEKAAWTVAVRTKAVMRRHCRTSTRVCVLSHPPQGPQHQWPEALGSSRASWPGSHLLPTGLIMSYEIRARICMHSLTAGPHWQILQPRKRPVQQRRRLLLRALYAVATCWEKLFALSAMTTREF